MNYRRWLLYFCLVVVLILVGAGFLELLRDVRSSKPEPVPETLRRLTQTGTPEQFPYLNQEKARRYRKILNRMNPGSGPTSPKRELINLSLKQIQELINAGNYTLALKRIRTLGDAPPPGTDKSRRTFLDQLKWFQAQALFLRSYKAVCDKASATVCSYPLHDWPGSVRADLKESRRLFSTLDERNFRSKSSRWFVTLIDQALSGELSAEARTTPAGETRPLLKDKTNRTPLGNRGRAGSVVVEDFNRDRHLDLLTSSMGIRDGDLRLYRGESDSSFQEISGKVDLSNRTGGLNVVHGDYNNDGYPDLYVLRGSGLRRVSVPNSLLKNVRGKRFKDVTSKVGLRRDVNSVTANWVDYNRDGHLDLFVGAEKEQSDRNNALLFRNDANGGFTLVSGSVGLHVPKEIKGSTWGDVNNDGRPDLYLSLHDDRNQLYLNRGRQFLRGERFVERAGGFGVDRPVHSFATWFWDYNNDGREDLFVYGGSSRTRWVSNLETGLRNDRNLQAGRPTVLENTGDGFVDVTDDLNLPYVPNVMGANFGDLNNDGRLDLLMGTGSPPPTGLAYNRLFINKGDSFTDVSKESTFSYLRRGHGIGVGDLDGDGQSEVIQSQGGVFGGNRRMNSYFDVRENDNNWFHLRLIGTRSNRDAVGARVALTIEEPSGTTRTLHRSVGAGGSFGDSSYRLEFGLARAALIRKLKVTWPRPHQPTEVFRDLKRNTFYMLNEGESRPVQTPRNHSDTSEKASF